MARLNFLCLFLVSWAALFGPTKDLCAEGWTSTLTPLAPGPFPEPRLARAEYHFGWNGITAATAELHLTKTADGRFQLETVGGTTGVVRGLWKFDARNTSTSDAHTLRPIQVHEIETARGKTLDTVVEFTPEKVTSRREERRGVKVKAKTRTFDFPNVLSLNSAMLYLRAQAFPEGSVTRTVVYPATSPYLCTITVLGREHVTVPTGNFDAIKLDLQLSKIGKQLELLPHKKFKRATVWLTSDSDHLVLRVEAQVSVGAVFAELQSVQYENGKP